MTLHWWMHWFWVTLWFAVIAGFPLSLTNRGSTGMTTTTTAGSATEEEKITREDHVTASNFFETLSERDEEETTAVKESFYVENEDFISTSPSSPSSPLSLSSLRENFRVPKAIGVNPTLSVIDEAKDDRLESREYPENLTVVKTDYRVDRDAKIDKNSVLKLDGGSNYTRDDLNVNSYNRTTVSGSNRSLSLVKKDSKVTWILTANKTNNSRNVKSTNVDNNVRNSSINDDNDDNLAVLPLDEPIPTTRFKLVLNRTKFIPSTNLNDHKLLNKSDDVEIRDDFVEPRLLATAASILQGVSESPRLSRARSAFPGDYQQDEQQEHKHYNEPSKNGFANATSSAIDVAAVTGSCLATLVLIGTMGSLGFVMYRRRYLNPPQTLNSDKCSNPDSSGYIDDSTIRDNSEEMYSLDNDSFLNSLEAMTIQNYWTDSVKHTKL